MRNFKSFEKELKFCSSLQLFSRMSSTEAVSMKTLKDFGYGFNSQGILRQLDPETGDLTDKPFEFEVSESRSENQKNYEALGESLTPYVYDLMEENGLHRVYLPVGQPESKATFIFSSQKELKDVNKLMVIIHGSGVVRAGQCEFFCWNFFLSILINWIFRGTKCHHQPLARCRNRVALCQESSS